MIPRAGLQTFKHPGNYQEGTIHKVITLGTPHFGTPNGRQVLLPLNECAATEFARFGVVFLRSAIVDGRDLNRDGDTTEIPAKAYAVASFDPNKPLLSQVTVKEIGACTTVNCGRGMSQQQLNLRVTKVFHVAGRTNVEAIGELFNLFNTINPGGFRTRVTIPSGSQANQPDPTLLQPTNFSGDFRRPEQRIGQIGVRFSF